MKNEKYKMKNQEDSLPISLIIFYFSFFIFHFTWTTN